MISFTPEPTGPHKVDHLCTFNDKHGNPRRIFVGWDKFGNVVCVANEHYDGYNAALWVKDAYERDVIRERTVPVAVYESYYLMAKAMKS